MPRRLTRPEVARRLAIKAAREARPALSFADLSELFAASRRTVRDAGRHTVAEWVAILAAAPVPSKHLAAGMPGKVAPPSKPSISRPRASRADAVLVPPEQEPDIEEPPADVDVPEPVFIEADPDVDILEPKDPRDPKDDPLPKHEREGKEDVD